jgi:hypothetical protein
LEREKGRKYARGKEEEGKKTRKREKSNEKGA